MLQIAFAPVLQSATKLQSLGVDEFGDDDEPTVAAASSILSASTVAPPVQSSGRSASSTVSMPHATSSSSSLAITDEYDPAAPNDYELICLERQKVAEAEKRLKSLREGTNDNFFRPSCKFERR
jgi:hypothetical protein